MVCAGAANAKRLSGPYGRRLQPVDADRFFVTHLVLETDVDVIARLDHLLGGLSEPGFIAIDRGNLKKAGQEQNERSENEHRHGAAMSARSKIKK